MFSEFLKFVKTDNLQGSFIDFYKEIQNEEHLELNLTARNQSYLKYCEDRWDELYKEKYGEHSSYLIKNKISCVWVKFQLFIINIWISG